jgi:hypothetical protein
LLSGGSKQVLDMLPEKNGLSPVKSPTNPYPVPVKQTMIAGMDLSLTLIYQFSVYPE